MSNYILSKDSKFHIKKINNKFYIRNVPISILLGGNFTATDPDLSFVRNGARLNSDGTIDNSFSIGTGFNNTVNVIAVQNDGKILVGGTFTNYNGTSRNRMIRLNSDGTIDNSFSIGTGFNNTVNVIAVQNDGKILVGGTFTSYNGTSRNRIIRLNSDGTIDSSFSIGIGVNSSVFSMVVQGDGKILVGGNFNNYNGTPRNGIIRLNSDGTIDNNFSIGTGFSNTVNVIAVQNDGRILVGGELGTYDDVNSWNFIIRLNSNGTVDDSFDVGEGFDNSVGTIAIQNDNKILVGGQFTNYNGTSRNRIIRLNSDGTIDNSFSIGSGSDSTVNVIAVQNDGKILVGGAFTNYNGTSRNKIFRLNSDGTVDNNLNIGAGFNITVTGISIQSDEKILVVGLFNSYSGNSRNRMVRLNSDWTLDNNFSIGTGFSNTVNVIAVQNDGKILAVGSFTIYNGTSRNRVIRLNSDGTIDNSFSIGTGFNSPIIDIAIQNDGKILVAGTFTSYNGTSRNGIIRLNSDGTIDNSFSIGTGFNSSANRIKVQNDGKIFVVGQFTAYNGNAKNYIARLNGDGDLDSNFSIGTGFNSFAIASAIQNDGKILAGGIFTNYNGTSKNRIIRLNIDGTADDGFSIGTGFDSTVNVIVVQNDNKILVGGAFTSYNGTSRNRMVRLNSDGTVDDGFSIGTGFNGSVLSIAVQSDGKILVGGNFTSYAGTSRNYVAKLNSDGTLDNNFDFDTNNTVNVII
jgi:uncharacterized delta-60 repeat protein